MSTESSLLTSATELRAYAPASDLNISSASSRKASARLLPVTSPENLRTEPRPIRFIIIALAVLFLLIFVVLPLVVVFASAFCWA